MGEREREIECALRRVEREEYTRPTRAGALSKYCFSFSFLFFFPPFHLCMVHTVFFSVRFRLPSHTYVFTYTCPTRRYLWLFCFCVPVATWCRLKLLLRRVACAPSLYSHSHYDAHRHDDHYFVIGLVGFAFLLGLVRICWFWLLSRLLNLCTNLCSKIIVRGSFFLTRLVTCLYFYNSAIILITEDIDRSRSIPPLWYLDRHRRNSHIWLFITALTAN